LSRQSVKRIKDVASPLAVYSLSSPGLCFFFLALPHLCRE